jgi:hypothetical protein
MRIAKRLLMGVGATALVALLLNLNRPEDSPCPRGSFGIGFEYR